MPPPTAPTTDARLTALETKVAALQTATLSVTQRMTSAEAEIAGLRLSKADATALAAVTASVQSLSDSVKILTVELGSKADDADLVALQDRVSTLEKQVAVLWNVYKPNPTPPPAVATDISPDSVTFADTMTGVIFTVTATGGVPDSYTYALTGPDAGLFSIDSGTGAVSAPSPITAGNYDISVQATNAKGTATFPIAITTTGDAFATPSESTLPAQTLCLDARVGGLWHVAASIVQSGITYTTNVPGFIVGASLGADTKNVQLALAGKGPTVVRVPAGNFTITQGVSFAGKTYWIGTKDGNGQPTTVFTGATGSTVLFSGSSTDPNTEGWAKDILPGPTDAQIVSGGVTYQQGGRAFSFSGAGRFSIINCFIRNIAEVGIYGSTATEWLSRRSLEVMVYDSEIAGCGTNAQEHNIYFHCGTFGFIRSITRDTRGSHALKVDCEKLIILDSRILRDTGIGLKGSGNHSAALNISPACDIRMARNLIQHVDPSTTSVSVMEIISRGNAGGGFSTKTPPSEDIEGDSGAVRDPDGMKGHWASTSFAPGVSKNIEAVVAAAAATGATSITLKFTASEGYKATRNVVLGTTYTLRVQRSDLTVQTIIAAPTVVGSATSTFPVSGGVGAPGIAANAKVSIKLDADVAWDYREPNSRYWNKNDPDYWWDAIRSGSALDLTKQDLFNTAYIQDNLFLINTPANSIKIIQQSADAPFEYAGNQEGTRANLPFPPINRPAGTTVDWPDDVAHGSWKEPLAGSGYPCYGRNPVTSDFVYRFPVFWADNGVAKIAGTIGEQFQQTVTGGTYDAHGDIRWLDSGGTLNQVLSTTVNRSPLPAFVTTTLASQGVNGSFTARVASIAGLVDGMAFQVDMQAPRGSDRTVHITTISGTPSGSSVTMADAWPTDVPVGSAAVGFTKAGAEPADWIPPSDYATR